MVKATEITSFFKIIISVNIDTVHDLSSNPLTIDESSSMPSRAKFVTEKEERKSRQEKFTKRSKSLFNKTKRLAEDTDAWVALIVRDKSGKVRSIRSSNVPDWPPSIQDLIVSRLLSISYYRC